MCLCFKKGLEIFILTSLFFGGQGVGGAQRRNGAGCHNVVDFNIGCKITNAYNKQNIYSVLKFTVQREFECSFLISVVGD